MDTTALNVADVLEAELRHILAARENRVASPPPSFNPPPPAGQETGPASRQRLLDRRVKEHYTRLHSDGTALSALCLSGGGIRSACFSLGVIQGLARMGVLRHFDYLSTVSGGGFLGGWLSAWLEKSTRPKGSLSDGGDDPFRGPIDAQNKVFKRLAFLRPGTPTRPEWEPVHFLRSYSSYLAPQCTLSSLDTWTLAAIFLRNIFLNWLLIFPAALVPFIVSRAYLAVILNPPGAPWDTVLLVVSCALLGVASGYAMYDMPSFNRRRSGGERKSLDPQVKAREKTKSGWLFIWVRLVPMLLFIHGFAVVWAWYLKQNSAESLRIGTVLLVSVIPVIVGVVGGFFVAALRLRALKRAPKKEPRKPSPAAEETQAAPPTRIRRKSPSTLVVSIATAICSVIGGLIVHFLATKGFAHIYASELNLLCFAAYAPSLILLVFVLCNYLLAGLTSRDMSDEDREWWGRSSGWWLLSLVAFSAQGSIIFFCPMLLRPMEERFGGMSVVGALALVSLVLGVITMLFGGTARARAETAKLWLRRTIAVGTAGAFLVCIFTLLAYSAHLLSGGDFAHPLHGGRYFLLVILASVILGFYVNVNTFSLHTVYRNRLIRAFLGASNTNRRPHAFTNFDAEDNVDMAALARVRPFHVVNVAMNTVATENLAWQERKAQPFTMSCLHCGSADPDVGYRPTSRFSGGVTLGTAMTISGAAANPNMGHHSSSTVSVVMTLLNLRLGWWVPNPAKEKAWSLEGPRWALAPLLTEALGQTTKNRSFLNLSDGGHFDNLGLYEMVRRRCQFIVVVDGGQDAKFAFDDLGNAIRRVRVDLGISIEITARHLVPVESAAAAGGVAGAGRSKQTECAFGVIRYSSYDHRDSFDPGGAASAAGASDASVTQSGSQIHAADGYLIYIKPTRFDDAPADVNSYGSGHDDFPHESTANQFFTESQLESYRELGTHCIRRLSGPQFEKLRSPARSESLRSFFERVDSRIAELTGSAPVLGMSMKDSIPEG